MVTSEISHSKIKSVDRTTSARKGQATKGHPFPIRYGINDLIYNILTNNKSNKHMKNIPLIIHKWQVSVKCAVTMMLIES